MHLLINPGHSNFKLCRGISDKMKREHGNTSYDIEPKVKPNGQIMYFLVNAYPPKLLDVAAANFAGA